MEPGPCLPPLSGERLERFTAFALSCSDAATAAAATERVAVARPVLLGFSGWPAAGKDTVPVELYRQLGLDPEHIYFAVPLKREVDQVIEAARGCATTSEAAAAVCEAMGVTVADGEWAASVIHAAAQADPGLHARTRVPEVRQLLQMWGTDVRRRDDVDYWVRQALAPAVAAVAEGRHAYLSDVRFPNEVQGAQHLGFHVTRLEVSRDTVVARLHERDGIVYDPADLDAMLAHPAESSLDHFRGFDLVLDNEGTVDDAVAAVRADVGL